jgi:hypothetical protein
MAVLDDLQVRAAIRETADAREKAETERAEAMTELASLSRRAVELRVPIAVIARDARLSRPSLYALLKGTKQ